MDSSVYDFGPDVSNLSEAHVAIVGFSDYSRFEVNVIIVGFGTDSGFGDLERDEPCPCAG